MSQYNYPPLDLEPNIADYLGSHFPGEENRFYYPVKIGSTPEDANKGAELILLGIKTATSSAPWHYPDGKVPFVGALSALVDGDGKPLAILETKRVTAIAFNKIDDSFAFDYGEGDRSLDWFRSNIGAWYKQDATRYGAAFNNDTKLICEWFDVHRPS